MDGFVFTVLQQIINRGVLKAVSPVFLRVSVECSGVVGGKSERYLWLPDRLFADQSVTDAVPEVVPVYDVRLQWPGANE
jgi:hypothetical protein